MHGIFTRLRVRILAIVLLAVIPAIGLILYSAGARKKQISKEIEGNLLRLSRFLASNLERDLLQGKGYLRAVSETVDFGGLKPDSCRSVMSSLLGDSSFYANMGIADPEGRVWCSAFPLPKAQELGTLEWFQEASIPGSLAVGFDYRGMLSRQASINLGMALPPKPGRRGGILFTVIDLEWLTRLAEKSHLPPGSALSLTNRQGDAVVRYPDPDKWVGKPYPQALMQEARLSQGEGVRIANGIDGVERLYAFSSVRGNGDFVVQIGIRLEEAHAPATRILHRQLAALGLVALLAILAAWFGADVFLLKQVNALIAATRRLAGGDLSARSALSYDKGELGDLARAFDEMAERLEWREAQLRESETERADPASRIHDLLEILPQAVLCINESQTIEAANQEARRLFGAEEEGMPGLAWRDLFTEPMGQELASPAGRQRSRFRVTGIRKDGTRIPMEIIFSKSNLNRKLILVLVAREEADSLASKET